MSGSVPLRIARRIVRLASLGAPPAEREGFRDEWEAELAAEAGRMDGPALLRAAWGAFADAGERRRIHRRNAPRTTTGGFGMRTWTQDLRVAVRSLGRAPAFTLIAVLTLAVGLGGSAAIYSLIDRVVLSPLPYPAADRLVQLQNQVPGVGPGERWNLSTGQWVYFTDNASTLEEVGLFQGTGGNMQTPSGPQRVQGVNVTASVMGLLGARARLGRLIGEADDRPGAPAVALVTPGFWERVLEEDPDIVGRTLTWNDEPVEVIGVLEETVRLPGWPASRVPDVWFPLQIDRGGQHWNSHVYPAVARLAPGATPESAMAEIDGFTPQLPEAFPNAYSQQFFDQYGFRTDVVPLKSYVLGNMERNLWLLFGGVLLVLAVAGANVANLFLVRVEDRRRELGIREALGAGRTSVARHLLSESLVLAGVGGTLALLVAYWAVPTITALAPDTLPRIQGSGLSLDAALLTLGLTLSLAAALTLYPLWAHASGDAAGALVTGERGTSAGRARTRVRSVLVVTQMALALTLAIGATLLIETMRGLYATDIGFEPDGVMAASLDLGSARYPSDVELWSFYRELLDRVEALPGVESAGLGEELPVEGGYGCTVQGFEDQAVHDRIRDAGSTTCAGQERVTPGYFETLGVPLLEGRLLEPGDYDDPTRASVVVSRAFAERFWPGESSVLGKGVAPSGRTIPPFYRVVGVVGDVPARAATGQAPLSEDAIALYYPVRKNPETPGNWGWWWPGNMELVVRSDGADPLAVAPAVRQVIADMDPEIPVSDVRAMETTVAEAMSDLSFISLLLGIAAAVAILLSAVGLYGVISYAVSRRTREIGMRLAIGAQPREVVGMVVRGSMLLAGLGLAVGVGLALGASGVMENLLVGVVTPRDPSAYLVAGGLLLAVALLAAWIPARRAAGIDPIEALRAE